MFFLKAFYFFCAFSNLSDLLFKMKNQHTFRLLSLVNKRLQCGTSKTLKAYSESAVPSRPTRGPEPGKGLLDRPRPSPTSRAGVALLVPAATTVLCTAELNVL